MRICDVTGAIHRSPIELAARLAELDAQITTMATIIQQYRSLFDAPSASAVSQIGDAFNAAHDAMDALINERADVEMNPLPIPAAEAGTYALMINNID